MEDSSKTIIKYNGNWLHLWKSLLISTIAAVLNILSTNVSAESAFSATVFCSFLSILLIMYSVYTLGLWGINVAFCSSLFFCLSVNMTLGLMLSNVLANVLQALLMWAFFKKTFIVMKTIHQEKHLTDYAILLSIIGVTYTILSFFVEHILLCIIFFMLITVLTIFISVIKKNKCWLLLLFAYTIPSLAGSLTNSIGFIIVENDNVRFIESIVIWTLSNVILLSTFGYVLLRILARKTINTASSYSGKALDLRINPATVLFYIAALLWNIWYYAMFFMGWLDYNTIVYLFPWLIGSIFFLANAYFSSQDDCVENDHKLFFKQTEDRAIVAENNTQKLIAIIAFMLPLCANWLGKITIEISICFIINITMAVVSIGLVWIPKHDIKSMHIIQTLKTIFHLYTLSFLLLVVIMIINGGIVAG